MGRIRCDWKAKAKETLGDRMSDEVEKWSQRHFGELALYRTIAATVNCILSVLVLAKLFGWL